MRTRDLPLAQARALIARAVDKAEQLDLRGAIVVVGGTGALVSASRMDRGGAGGLARARSKAWIAATQQIPSTEHLGRMNSLSVHIANGFVACSPQARFPGAGGMPISRDGEIVAGVAASGATVSPFPPAGADPQTMIADGKPGNPEDIVIHYALGLPYVGQHGDDLARWEARFGPFPADPGPGLGMVTAPPASRQDEYTWAVQLADRAIAEAQARGVRIAVSIVDTYGEPIQVDRMDDAPSAAVELAQAVAATAAAFQLPSHDVERAYGADNLAAMASVLPFPLLGMRGGLPIQRDGVVVAGLGVAGVAPGIAAQIAFTTMIDA